MNPNQDSNDDTVNLLQKKKMSILPSKNLKNIQFKIVFTRLKIIPIGIKI